MAEELIVYLDHLIPRQNLRYRRSDEYYNEHPKIDTLNISDLLNENLAARVKLLRKPDFQRATWSWTPEECVQLLESVINDQVIPSIIMWLNPEGDYYVLDGGHRISVILAWLRDDWGDEPKGVTLDPDIKLKIQKAAREVRNLVKNKIGAFSDYTESDKEFDRVMEEGKAPKQELNDKIYNRAKFYRKIIGGHVGFPLLWVTGNYEKAELSFLRINKSGKQLSPWETILVENRNSSFARVVMSLTSLASLKHYWPPVDVDLSTEVQNKISSIIINIEKLNKLLFQPNNLTRLTSESFPLMYVPELQKKPVWISELLTVIEGGRGREAETEKLLKKGASAKPEEIVNTGDEIVRNVLQVIEQLTGSGPTSLSLVPQIYFYGNDKRYVRSLLYGFIYWLFNSGVEKTILDRKLTFTAYRSVFEHVIFNEKSNITSLMTRKTGSGPEVTIQTAEFFQDLCELIVKCKGSVESENFLIEYNSRLTAPGRKMISISSKSLTSTFPNQCTICGGVLLSYERTPFELEHLVHPFCEANSKQITAIKAGKANMNLPLFRVSEVSPEVRQLSFFDMADFEPFSPSQV